MDPSKCVERAQVGVVLGVGMGAIWGASDASREAMRAVPKGKGRFAVLDAIRNDSALRKLVLQRQFGGLAFVTAWSALFQTGRCLADQKRLNDVDSAMFSYLLSVAPFVPFKAARRHFLVTVGMTGMDSYFRFMRANSGSAPAQRW
jgi:hypothetical protein